ncbi:hypothetical protein CR513_60675, partial [Mucuna pruriens]
MEDLKAAGEREEELLRQLAGVKATIEKLGGAGPPPPTPSAAFWEQPFSEEIDETSIPPNFHEVVIESFDGTQDPHTYLQAFQTQMYISGGNDRLSCKLFPRILRGVAMNWLATLLSRSIRSFTNKVKHLELADLFHIRQNKGETPKVT